MLKHALATFMQRRKCTLLGVGPMSLNCVNASIALANACNIPIMLIASRRQIDAAAYGGGYVEGWTTEDFANYVLDNDKKGKIILARDHGGPWQNPLEKERNLGLRRAMQSAKMSYAADIAAGFQIIHIDPSIDIHGTPSVDDVLERLFELYEFCWHEARRQQKEILFEVGTEEQSGSAESLDSIEYALEQIHAFCRRSSLPQPTFIVMQTGTKVMETRNVGILDQPFRICGEIPAEIQIPRLMSLCARFDIWLKQHNTDYLSNETLRWHPHLGIHSANVAPEFGVVETRALLEILRTYQLDTLADDFLQLAWNSRKWEKWLAPDSSASPEEQSIMAGHYVFASPECREIKSRAQKALDTHGIRLDALLTEAVKNAILRYLYNFHMVDVR